MFSNTGSTVAMRWLTKGEEYTDQGQSYYEERYRERVLRAQSQRAAKLGMLMVLIASVEQSQPV